MKNLRTHHSSVATRGALRPRPRTNSLFKTALRPLVIGVLVAGGLAIGFVPAANASLIGDSVLVETQFGGFVFSDVVTVGAGNELEGGDSSDHATDKSGPGSRFLLLGDFIDIGADRVTFSFEPTPGILSFSVQFSDLDWTDAPGRLVSVFAESGSQGIASVDILFVDDSLFVIAAVVDGFNSGREFFTIVLNTTHDPVPVPPALIPLPAALPLYGTGLAVMGFIGWRRKRQALRD